MSATAAPPTVAAVRGALASVDDPEHPGVSIADLGLIVDVRLRDARAEVDLVPTYSGCPARSMIAADVRAAITSLPGVHDVTVRWLDQAWSPDRVSPRARRALAEEYTVVLRRTDGSLLCPVCGSTAVADTSDAGPTRCRSLAWCPDCRNAVEVLR